MRGASPESQSVSPRRQETLYEFNSGAAEFAEAYDEVARCERHSGLAQSPARNDHRRDIRDFAYSDISVSRIPRVKKGFFTRR